jgi:hypothetical protein
MTKDKGKLFKLCPPCSQNYCPYKWVLVLGHSSFNLFLLITILQHVRILLLITIETVRHGSHHDPLFGRTSRPVPLHIKLNYLYYSHSQVLTDNQLLYLRKKCFKTTFS